MANETNNRRDLEIDKSVNKLIAIQKKGRAIKLSDQDFRNQYIMASRFEVSRLKKLGFDITEEELNKRVEEKEFQEKNSEMEKSIRILIAKRKKMTFNDMNDLNQYKMAINLEVTKLRKIGHNDVTTELLDSMVDTRIRQEKMADEAVNNMANNPILSTFNKQKGYTMIGILGLITCVATIGIIIYGYILFYR